MTDKEKDISTELEKYKQQGGNLLMPSTHIAGLSEYHQPIIETVLLSADPNNGDVYPHDNADAGPNKKWRPTKQALMKLSVCAGVIWSTTDSKRTDNGASRDYISYKAVGGVKKADGQPVFFSAEYDIDFEVIEEELRDSYTKKVKTAGWAKDKSDEFKARYIDDCVKRDMLQKRKFKLRLCEAGAMNRVLRMLLGLKQAYTTAELAKPFVMARIVFRPDFSDSAVRKQFVDASIKAMTGIYGPAALDQEVRNSKPIDITPLPDEEPAEPEPAPPAAETKQSEPPPKPESPAPDSKLVDFQNSDQAGQCKAINNLVKTTGYDLAGYLSRCRVTNLEVLTDESRLGLFKHLLSLEAMKLGDVPY